MNPLIEVIKPILSITLPLIARIIEAKFIPPSKEFLYKNLDEAVNAAVESLTKLKTKIKDTDNEFDNIAFKLGLDVLKATADKIAKAVAILEA